MRSPWPRSLVLRILAAIWSCPLGLLGLAGQALFWALGWGRPVLRDGAFETVVSGPLARWLDSRGWEGFTLGWSVFYWFSPCEWVRFHEHRHVRQYLAAGPLMFVLYPLASLCAWLDGERGYTGNWFEEDANDAADREAGI